ncbi:MAG: RNA-binding transcriptional accessory protein [Bacteroidetes bacterium]|nr:RNA-binding transcriptional accessory protein [Bacteroidota bacterium]HET6244897.1 Tex family protein [Bacteroidia bacterium]
MNKKHIDFLARTLNLPAFKISSTADLIDLGGTVPFIARYRKEATGGLDEVQILAIKEGLVKLLELEKRRESILHSIREQGKLSEELEKKIQESWDISELEDIYLPYKQKRKTKADAAREKGLEPLAKILMAQQENDPEKRALQFLNKDVTSIEDAIQGAKDIIAEWVNENLQARGLIRKLYEREAFVKSKLVKGKDEDAIKYKDYFKYEEKLSKIPSHRMLAIRRAETEGFLKIDISPSEENALSGLYRLFVKANNESSVMVEKAVKQSYNRLLQPSIETEFRNSSKEKADDEAIKVFADNLRQLLLAPPLGQKRILAIDPGFRSGCKVVCLDEQGSLLHNETIFPHKPQEQLKQAVAKIYNLVDTYNIDAISIGNGTAGRETESFIQKLKFNRKVQVFIVNEAGASVYSASPVAREEFPQFDVTVRGAVSIGRRLMDPLAELVKIEPKAIGVGQYQHDVNQEKLQLNLDSVIENCVNKVGVNLNTASKHLLTYVSGLGEKLAQNIIDYRNENGAFTSRQDLKKVPRLGDKAFEQSAGFMRIRGAVNPLDNTSVHPESYFIAEKMARDLKCTVVDLIQKTELREKIDPSKYISEKTGMPTLLDILAELEKPGLDPRTIIKIFQFAKDIYKVEQLVPGMELPGIVTNITNFGAFVDVGVKQDGLVHISQLADAFVSNPADVVKLNQHVKVKVLEVDLQRKRIAFTMKGLN